MIGGDSPCVLALCGREAAFPPVPPNPAPFCPKLPEPVLQAGLAPLAPPAEADPNPNHVSPTPVTLSALTTLSPTVPGNLCKPVEAPDVNHGQRVLPERTVMDMECPEPMSKDVQGTPQRPVPKSPCPETSGKQASVPESQKMPNTCGVRPVALLSFFDGIATAHQALVDLKIKPIVSWSWETDEACRKVVKARRPDIVQFGDALATSPEEVIARLQSSCPANALVLVCAAPPCLDFTIMKGSAAAGVRGQEGNKFIQWCVWWKQFKSKSPFLLALLVEHVVPSAEIQSSLDECLGVRSFLCDAASWGLVSRPRLWWSESIKVPENEEKLPGHLLSGLARWRRWNHQWELLPCARQVAAECPFARFHTDVCSGRVRYPCLTTPAPTDRGRSAPLKRKRAESPETMRRWREGGQQYPPCWSPSKAA